MYEDLIRALRCTKNENDDCPTCKYQVLCEGRYDYCDQEQLEIDAAEAFKALEAENAALRGQLARVTAERDAAMKDLRLSAWCKTCTKGCGVTEALSKRSNGTCPEYEWRGPQKEDR